MTLRDLRAALRLGHAVSRLRDVLADRELASTLADLGDVCAAEPQGAGFLRTTRYFVEKPMRNESFACRVCVPSLFSS